MYRLDSAEISMYVADFRRRNMGQRTEKGRTAKRAKGKQTHPSREWTFVYGNGFGRSPTVGKSQPT